jgi:DNA mismatch repair protein MutL
MNGELTRLDEATVAEIAAGEVISRPARVVGELVDNALDAGASKIEIAVDGDGTDRIRVADDGHGLPGRTPNAQSSDTRRASSRPTPAAGRLRATPLAR